MDYSSKKGRLAAGIFLLTVFLLSVYSYALVDPNITLVKTKTWTVWRNAAVALGYYHRSLSTIIFITLTSLLFLAHLLVRRTKSNTLSLAFLTAGITLFAYPFLSRDFFNYLFDAKIVTVYHKNPYFFKALDFPSDPWLRFMHWTHRTYPYGPAWLIQTMLPSWLGLNKFFLTFILFKMLFAAFYLGSVQILKKMDNDKALFFATHPLVIIEGLISPHNDLSAVFFGFLFLYFLKNKRWLSSLGAGVISFLVKYITLFLAVFLLPMKSKRQITVSGVFFGGIITYLLIKNGFYPWYFLNFFLFLPFVTINELSLLSLFSFLIIFTYTPFVLYGDWTPATSLMRMYLFFSALFVSIIYALFRAQSVRKFFIR